VTRWAMAAASVRSFLRCERRCNERMGENQSCGMSPYIHRLDRYVNWLTDEYTVMYIHRLTDEYIGPKFIGFNYLCQLRYRGIYTCYIPGYQGI
jgi:hypothetical protein